MVIRTQFYYPEVEQSLSMAVRQGERPHTSRGLPYVQLDQWPPLEIALELVERSLRLPYVQTRESRMASPDSYALSLPDNFACGPAGAFIDGHEFCHLHPPPESGIHLVLPRELQQQAIEMGWAEQHPVARLGCLTEGLLMVYAPRDHEELEVVMRLIHASYDFARGN